jgi:hypothetical protein
MADDTARKRVQPFPPLSRLVARRHNSDGQAEVGA